MKLIDRANAWMTDLYLDVQHQMKANPADNRKCFGIGAFIGILLFGSQVAFADATIDEFGNSVADIIWNIYQKAFAIVTVLAALLAVIAFVVRMSGNQQRAAQATQWLVRILIAYVGINAIGIISRIISNTTSNYRFQKSDYQGAGT